jgi:L-fucose isomerase-like protein
MTAAQYRAYAASKLNARRSRWPSSTAPAVSSAHLALSGRKTILEVLDKAGIKAIIPAEDATRMGAIESLEEAHLCADLFKAHRDEIDGILVTLPNFGDERAIANTIRFSGLNVPVLIHAFPDDVSKMDIQNRRDSFCGKMSCCNNLHQYGIKYTLTSQHTMDPASDAFMTDLKKFAGVCRVVRGMRTARVACSGARPEAFKTVRFSEKMLDRAGISVETLDLSEVYGRIERLADNDAAVVAKLADIRKYAQNQNVPELSLMRMAKFGVVLDGWIEANHSMRPRSVLDSMEEYFGVVPCTMMSMSSNKLSPRPAKPTSSARWACWPSSWLPAVPRPWSTEQQLRRRSGQGRGLPLLEPAQGHPGRDIPVMDYQEIIAGSVARKNTFGTIYGRVKAAPFTYLRVSTDEFSGQIMAYTGEGKFTNDPIDTFGGTASSRCPTTRHCWPYLQQWI